MGSLCEKQETFKKNRNYKKIAICNQKEAIDMFGTYNEERWLVEFKTIKVKEAKENNEYPT